MTRLNPSYEAQYTDTIFDIRSVARDLDFRNRVITQDHWAPNLDPIDKIRDFTDAVDAYTRIRGPWPR